MRRNRTHKRLMTDINVVPYIDVMLVLLVIFMITTPLLSQGVKVQLPQAAAKPITSVESIPLIVTVDIKGQYYLNASAAPSVPLEPEDLATQVAARVALAKQQGQHKDVFVKGDAHVDYGKVVAAMVLLQQAGVDNVGLMTDQPKHSIG